MAIFANKNISLRSIPTLDIKFDYDCPISLTRFSISKYSHMDFFFLAQGHIILKVVRWLKFEIDEDYACPCYLQV